MIVKGTDDEARNLSQCLGYVAPYMDGLFITRSQPKGEKKNEKVEKVCRAFGAEMSDFDWVNDFSKARNYNFSQVPKEYDYIMWLDADDAVRGMEHLRGMIQKNPADVYVMNYLYAFDEYKNPVVVHLKSQIVKNDGCVEWVGKLHEDFKSNRQIKSYFLKGVERIHLSTDERFEQAKKRNVEISREDVEKNPKDPRSYWNLGQSLSGAGQHDEALKVFDRFLVMSKSEDEKYIVRIRMAEIYAHRQEWAKGIEHLQVAIGIKPEYPDAYIYMGYLYNDMNNLELAEKYLLLGITKKPPYYDIIVYNPRDYDYHPLMVLAKVYFKMSRPDNALVCLEACAKIYPNRKDIKDLMKKIKKMSDEFKQAHELVKRLENKSDKVVIKELEKSKLGHQPLVQIFRNKRFIKKESSGKDLVFYCYPTEEEWNPDSIINGGIGGSEESVIYTSKYLAEKGWNVTVYANCGQAKKYGKVQWKPWWLWNYRDKQDVVILWRSPAPAQFEINCDKVIVDLHDVIQEREFTEERLKRISKIFVKTNYHRSLLPNIPNEKFEIIPNGQDFSLLNQKVEKDQYLMVNTSSPDRSLSALARLFKRVKEQVPEAKCKWAYGWGVFDASRTSTQEQEWKKETIKEAEKAGVEMLGRVNHKEVAKLYSQANILAYPTLFPEIDCITVKKAQACGALPVTTNFGALNESVKYGVKVDVPKEIPNDFDFGLNIKEAEDKWVEECVRILKTPIEDRKEMKQWTKKFAWPNIAEKWNNGIINIC